MVLMLCADGRCYGAQVRFAMMHGHYGLLELLCLLIVEFDPTTPQKGKSVRSGSPRP